MLGLMPGHPDPSRSLLGTFLQERMLGVMSEHVDAMHRTGETAVILAAQRGKDACLRLLVIACACVCLCVAYDCLCLRVSACACLRVLMIACACLCLIVLT